MGLLVGGVNSRYHGSQRMKAKKMKSQSYRRQYFTESGSVIAASVVG